MTILGILWWCLFGLIAGALAKFIYPNNSEMSWPVTILLGIGGAIFGGWIGGVLGMGDGAPGGFITAVIGALLLLFIYERFLKKS